MVTSPDKNPFLAAFRRIVVKRGLTPATLSSGQHADFLVVTAAASLALAAGRHYAEAQVNALLKDWLAGPGAMLETDHVELRRWLVDCRLVARDGYGRDYWRPAAPAAWEDALAALDGVDLAAEAVAAREGDARERAERKARWKAKAPASVARK
jgi:hypothetical protein